MAGLGFWQVLLRGWGFEGRRNFLKAKTDKEDNGLTPECVECGRKIPLQRELRRITKHLRARRQRD